MPRPRPRHLHRQKTRHGETVWYVRVGHGPRIRIKGAHGSPEFMASYDEAVEGEPAATTRKSAGATSTRWLWDRYRETQAWAKLSLATRRQRENIMRGVLASDGDYPFKNVSRKAIVSGRDKRAATPAMARHFVDTMRGMFAWALDAEHVDADPTHGVKAEKPETDGHKAWADDELARFRAFYAIGTRERLAFELLAHTGIRRGDLVRAGRQMVSNGVLTMKTEKTGSIINIPIAPELAAVIAASPTGDMAFFVGQKGFPMTKESFGNWFREACHAAGCPGRAHGIRKALAEDGAEKGMTEKEMEAYFGWEGGGMASLYTKRANRKKLAAAAAAKLRPEQTPTALFPHQKEGEGIEAKTSDKSAT